MLSPFQELLATLNFKRIEYKYCGPTSLALLLAERKLMNPKDRKELKVLH